MTHILCLTVFNPFFCPAALNFMHFFHVFIKFVDFLVISNAFFFKNKHIFGTACLNMQKYACFL